MATATGTLDQSQTGSDFIDYLPSPLSATGVLFGQTFTDGLTGNLTQVDLELAQGSNCPADQPLQVAIETTSGGLPTDTVIASATVQPSSVPSTLTWTSIQFSPGAAVTAGVQYAIVLSSQASSCATAGPSWEWATDHGGLLTTYTGGQFVHSANSGTSWLLDPWEATFETYVVTPSDQAATLVTASSGVGPGTALADKASAIQAAVNAGQNATACQDIANYLGLVSAQAAKKLSAQAAALTADATSLSTAIGC